MFVTYDRPNLLTDCHEIFWDYSVPSREGHYNIKFLKGQNRISPKKYEFFPEWYLFFKRSQQRATGNS